ncbi:MAG TPA: hypothetical protein QGF86_08295 [Nitrospinaceae bacterium]|nr:hypothetical protein [Nitrospinaceae bacterium]
MDFRRFIPLSQRFRLMDETEWDKLRYQELIVLRSLLKKQNELLG